ncbi:MAG TPA: branched-chain amino acid ABC transporter substrate-binding protein [Acidimicrobiales bacterium]|nr:branched-chain amino acid ABC transporter substrate-binding protein [Acidimicrobiales bacterium]
MGQRRGRPWRRSPALLLVAGVILAACGSDNGEGGGAGQPGGKRKVSIAFVGAKTGDNANLGLNIRDGAKLAVDEENAKGGNVTIELKEFDTAGDSAQASTIKDQFIGDESIVGVVGSAFSGETKALLPAFQEGGLVMISPSATNKDLPNVVPNQTVFHRTIADDALQASGIAEYLANVEKPATAAYVHDNTEYGKGLTVDVEKAATAKGVKRAGNIEVVDPKAQDFSATVNKVKDAALVFYGGYYAEAGRFKKQLADAQSKAKFLSGDGSLDSGFVTSAGGAAAEEARLSCPCNLALESSQGNLKAFYDNFKQKIGREPGLYSPEGYDSTKLLIQGIKAGNDTRPKLLQYVENDVGVYEGVSKTIEFEANGNLKSRQFFVFQVKGGKIVPLQTLTVGGSGTGAESSSGGSTTTTTGGATTTTAG